MKTKFFASEDRSSLRINGLIFDGDLIGRRSNLYPIPKLHSILGLSLFSSKAPTQEK